MTLKGLDVSSYNGHIDWKQVAAAGYSFVFCKAVEGATLHDPTFATNYAGAKAAGILRGAYQFARPKTSSALDEANSFVSIVNAAGGFELPPVLDMEDNGGLSASALQSYCRTWGARVQTLTGRRPVLYSYTAFIHQYGLESLDDVFDLWVADYNVSSPSIHNWRFWQHSDAGSVPGITGHVDMDVFNGVIGDLKQLAKAVLPDNQLWGQYKNSGKPRPKNGHLRKYYGATLDQGQLGSCSAFGGTQWNAALMVMGGAPYFHGSELADYYEERVLNGTVSSDSGASVEEAIQVLEQFGMMPETSDPYVISKYTVAPPSDWVASTKLKPSQALQVNSLNDALDALATGHPILAGINVYAELEGGLCANTGVLTMPADPSNCIGGHMINIIGWDDDAQMLLCLNQWGASWGIKDAGFEGCFWMPYAYWSNVIGAIAGVSSNGVNPTPDALTIAPQKLDVYAATASIDKSQVTVGEPFTLTLTFTKNGQPFVASGADYYVQNTAGNAGYEATMNADANGQIHYTYTPQTADTWYGGTHFLTPYGDFIMASAQCVSVMPVVEPPIHVQLVENYVGVVDSGNTMVPPELWQRVGNVTNVDSTHVSFNGKTYPSVTQNGVLYVHWQILTNNGFKITHISDGWSFSK